MDIAARVVSELLALVRKVKYEIGTNPAFAAVSSEKKGVEYFQSYGTKLLLASGWHVPSDVNRGDLISLKAAQLNGLFPEIAPFHMLLDVLERAYGSRSAFSAVDWQDLVKSSEVQIAAGNFDEGTDDIRLEEKVSQQQTLVDSKALQSFDRRDDIELIRAALARPPLIGRTERLLMRHALPGIASPFSELSAIWLQIESLYLNKTKQENNKNSVIALAYLNIYLFFYLPYWFESHQCSSIKYPLHPQQLAAAIFITRLTKVDVDTPITLMEMMNAISVNRNWSNNSYYGLLLQIEKFFAFIERYHEELPSCLGFRQPMSRDDYPRTSRGGVTPKRPIPPRIFPVLIEYVEALRYHLLCIQELIVARHLNGEDINRFIGHDSVFDSFLLAERFGLCIPIIFTEAGVVALRYIPDCLGMERFTLKSGEDGFSCMLPTPHALNQIITALYTGLRNNHIQWLDARTFDSKASDQGESCELYVNTDKSKTGSWTPIVNRRVIEVLRSQLDWRNSIDNPGFSNMHCYNNNPQTKWPKILPLFSLYSDGRPHQDGRYAYAWLKVLGGLQSILTEMREPKFLSLCQLSPTGVEYNDADAYHKKVRFGKKCEEESARFCALRLCSAVTPHSCRVTVVSQHITFLPAELIGKYITGQTVPCVHYYVRVDPELLSLERVNQALELRKRAARAGFDGLTGEKPADNQFIQADKVNSNLAQSLRANLEETLVRFGCVSLSMSEDGRNGLDVLRETRAVNAAENKTEICPYGNFCPPEIILQWRGIRRCGVCQYAVRSVDHLDAVTVKVHSTREELVALTERITKAIRQKPCPYTDKELNQYEAQRNQLGEDLSGWIASEEVLTLGIERLRSGEDTRRWFVQSPEAVIRDLQRVEVPSNLTSYILLRLQECVAYPSLETPEIRARLDLLRRTLLAHSGKLAEAFDRDTPVSPSAECAGLLRTLVNANGLSFDDLARIIEGDPALDVLRHNRVLALTGESGE